MLVCRTVYKSSSLPGSACAFFSPAWTSNTSVAPKLRSSQQSSEEISPRRISMVACRVSSRFLYVELPHNKTLSVDHVLSSVEHGLFVLFVCLFVCLFACLLACLLGWFVSFSLFKDASSVGRVGCVFWRDGFTGTVFETRRYDDMNLECEPFWVKLEHSEKQNVCCKCWKSYNHGRTKHSTRSEQECKNPKTCSSNGVCVCVVAAQYPLTCFIHFIS